MKDMGKTSTGNGEFGEDDVYIHYLDCGGDFIFMYVGQSLSNCTLKCVQFIAGY